MQFFVCLCSYSNDPTYVEALFLLAQLVIIFKKIFCCRWEPVWKPSLLVWSQNSPSSCVLVKRTASRDSMSSLIIRPSLARHRHSYQLLMSSSKHTSPSTSTTMKYSTTSICSSTVFNIDVGSVKGSLRVKELRARLAQHLRHFVSHTTKVLHCFAII